MNSAVSSNYLIAVNVEEAGSVVETVMLGNCVLRL
jgi:hypothetical protein